MNRSTLLSTIATDICTGCGVTAATMDSVLDDIANNCIMPEDLAGTGNTAASGALTSSLPFSVQASQLSGQYTVTFAAGLGLQQTAPFFNYVHCDPTASPVEYAIMAYGDSEAYSVAIAAAGVPGVTQVYTGAVCVWYGPSDSGAQDTLAETLGGGSPTNSGMIFVYLASGQTTGAMAVYGQDGNGNSAIDCNGNFVLQAYDGNPSYPPGIGSTYPPGAMWLDTSTSPPSIAYSPDGSTVLHLNAS